MASLTVDCDIKLTTSLFSDSGQSNLVEDKQLLAAIHQETTSCPSSGTDTLPLENVERKFKV